MLHREESLWNLFHPLAHSLLDLFAIRGAAIVRGTTKQRLAA